MATNDLRVVQEKAEAAVAAVEADKDASPVLLAVTEEFARKAGKAVELAGGDRRWEAVVEVEQAGDSAKAAVEADAGAGESTRTAVQDAHLAICMLKASYAQPVP
jgi:hypothetical protein